ncbi:hypothetical protein AB7K28_22790, partial [Klebsiella pneumoniae]
RAYCLKIQPATGSFARNLIYSTKPRRPVIALSEGNMRDLSVRRWVRKLPLRFMVGEYYLCQDRLDNMSCYTI